MLTPDEIREIKNKSNHVQEWDSVSANYTMRKLLSHVDKLSQKLPCGHPIQCLRVTKNDEMICGWCEDMK